MTILVFLEPLNWRLWPWYRRYAEPGKVWIGPLVIRWWRS